MVLEEKKATKSGHISLILPEYPNGTYYYVITSDFPVTPNCFMGTPDEDWQIGM